MTRKFLGVSMSKDSVMCVGDIFFRFNKPFKVVDIKDNLKDVSCIFYEPVFKDNRNRSTIWSTPIKSLDEINYRLPTPKDKLKKLVKNLKEYPEDTTYLSANQILEFIKENNIEQIANIIKMLHFEKSNPDKVMALTKKDYLQKSLEILTAEIAVVYEISLKEAEELIFSKLSQMTPAPSSK